MKTFKDLKFEKHPIIEGAVQAVIDFDNGHWVSVVGGGKGLYGNGRTSFEVLSSLIDRRSCFIGGSQSNTLKVWQDAKQITAHMRYLQTKKNK